MFSLHSLNTFFKNFLVCKYNNGSHGCISKKHFFSIKIGMSVHFNSIAFAKISLALLLLEAIFKKKIYRKVRYYIGPQLNSF